MRACGPNDETKYRAVTKCLESTLAEDSAMEASGATHKRTTRVKREASRPQAPTPEQATAS
jgi:hypothetical protein